MPKKANGPQTLGMWRLTFRQSIGVLQVHRVDLLPEMAMQTRTMSYQARVRKYPRCKSGWGFVVTPLEKYGLYWLCDLGCELRGLHLYTEHGNKIYLLELCGFTRKVYLGCWVWYLGHRRYTVEYGFENLTAERRSQLSMYKMVVGTIRAAYAGAWALV